MPQLFFFFLYPAEQLYYIHTTLPTSAASSLGIHG
jgi:hypothetical protein